MYPDRDFHLISSVLLSCENLKFKNCQPFTDAINIILFYLEL